MKIPPPHNFSETFHFLKKSIRKFLPEFLLQFYLILFPTFGYFLYGRPSRKLKVIGVTGTDGKSSTVILIARILQEAGYRVGFTSSVFFHDGLKEYQNDQKMTMPGRFFLQRFLSKLVQNKCEYAVIEVTSEGIRQKRHLWIDFDVAVITNLYPEHIEAHGGFENYKKAKAQIFRTLHRKWPKSIQKTIVVNADEESVRDFKDFPAEQKLSFGMGKSPADVRAKILETSFKRNRVKINTPREEFELILALGGPFIISNMLAAITVCYGLGVPGRICKATLEKIKPIPGRFEVIHDAPLIIVDYAHTTTALRKLLEYLRSQWPHQIIHIFGAAGGGRDRWKRQKLAELSERFTDLSIVTEENSFDESTAEILRDIQVGFSENRKVFVIPERKKALKKALELSTPETLILATAKGSETVKAGPFGRKIPYNEKDTFLWLLKRR